MFLYYTLTKAFIKNLKAELRLTIQHFESYHRFYCTEILTQLVYSINENNPPLKFYIP